MRSCCGSKDKTNREVPGSNMLAAAAMPLGKALNARCVVPWKGLKALGPLVA